MECELGKLYHRQATPQRSDVYWMNVTPGQVLALGLLSEAIDSRLRGAVTVSDESGRVIASAVGDSSGDVFRSIGIPAGVRRIAIAVEDVLYRGGPQYGYVFSVAEENNAEPLRRLVQPQHPRCVSARFGAPQWLDESTDPVRIELPSLIESEFGSQTDQDQYVCSLEKGQTIQLSCYSDRLGEPTDTRIVVHRSVADSSGAVNWQRVAAADDSQGVSDTAVNFNSRDTELTFTAPEKGEYRVTVADQDSGEFLSKRQRYVLSVGSVSADPILVAYHVYPHRDVNTSRPSGIHLPRGGATVIRVFALRRGFAGPIEVSMRALPKGLSCEAATIAPDRSQTDLVVLSAQDTPPAIQSVEVVGQFSRGETPVEVVAVPVSLLWERDGQQPKIRSRVCDGLIVYATDQDTLPVTVGPATIEPFQVVKGNKLKVPLKIARHDGTKNNVVFRARDLPTGVKAGDLNVGGDKTEAEWTIDVTAATKPGRYRFYAQAETKVKYAPNPQALARESAYHEALKKMRDEPSRAAEHPEIDKALAVSNTKIEALKKQTAARDFTIFVPTHMITLDVTDQ